VNRRSVLAGAAAGVAMVPVSSMARLFGRGGAPSGAPPPSGLITTLTLVSTSGSTVGAGAPVPPFGLQFADGDIPSGEYPELQFDSDDSVWPCTFSQVRSWASGAMKHCSVIPACSPKAITTGGITVNVLSGGSAPAASGRSRTEIYAANFVTKMTGAGSNFGLTGAWTAELENDANNFQKVTYADGGGGLSERHWTKVNAAGTPHGQLECLHYVVAVNDTSGNLAGFWYLPRVWQPYYNQDTPAKGWRALSAFTIDSVGPGGSGTATITPPFGYTARDVTWTSGASFTCNTTPDWYHGAGQHEAAYNSVPCVLTTTGTLPAGWSLTQLYFVHANSDNTNSLSLTSAASTEAPATATNGGSGTHTLTPVRNVLHFGSQFGATAEGKSNWVQAQGSVSAPGLVQVRFDPVYRRSTRCFLPFDLSITIDSCLTSVGSYTYSWDTLSVGPLTLHTAGAGNRGDIGLITDWQRRHFSNQAVVDELYARMIGLSRAHFGTGLYDLSTHGPAQLYNATYANMPTTGYDTLTWNPSAGTTGAGFTLPPNTNVCAGFDGTTTDHMPSTAAYAYEVFGEPVYLDLILEAAMGGLLQYGPGARNPTSPSTAYGVVTEFAYTIRNLAWALRDLVFADGLWPDTDPYGTGIPDMLSDCRTASVNWPNLWIAGGNSYVSTNKLWAPNNTQHAPWMLDYTAHTYTLAYTLCEDANALTMLQGMQTWWNYVATTFSYGQIYTYYDLVYVDGGTPYTDPDTISDDAHFASLGAGMVGLPSGVAISWASGTPGVFTAIEPGQGYTPANGDKWIFPAYDNHAQPVTPPGGLSSNTPYYAVNRSGNTFNLSATPGGSAINISTTSAGLGVENIGLVPVSFTSTGMVSNYQEVRLGVFQCMTAAGVTGMSSLLSDCQTRFNALSPPVDFNNYPKWAMNTSW